MTPEERSMMGGYVACMMKREPPKSASVAWRVGYRSAVRERIWSFQRKCEQLREVENEAKAAY